MGHDLISNEQKATILELAIKALDGDLLPSESKYLADCISASKALGAYYSKCIKMHLSMMELERSHRLSHENHPALDREFWQMLAIQEQTSPEIKIPPEPQPQEYVRAMKCDKPVYKIRRSSIFTLAASAAAVLFIILFAHYVPPKADTKVAVLSDSLDAKWANISGSMPIGSYLASGKEPLLLREGIVELMFDNQARVTVEGPAEFQIAMADQITLKYGRLYAHIPPEAMGFTVSTANSKIIDLGTEFGVETSLDGTTELHVLEGRTTLISGSKNKVSMPVTEGIAKKVSGSGGQVSDIACAQTKFVRKIHSSQGHIWRGEHISLTSLVAGGSGFEDVPLLVGINPATGEFTASIVSDNRASKQPYHLVGDSPFIDGVFVPDGQGGPIPVTSMGHTFDCPNTGGFFTHEIAAYKGSIEGRRTTIPPAVLNDKAYDTNAVVMLHSNIGITFDLQAIRTSLPALKLERFKAFGILTEAISDVEKNPPDIDFWVLVDGRIKYEKKMMTLDSDPVSLDIEFAPQDRFLTLIVTDGLRAEDGKRPFPHSNDFFYLIKPELYLTEGLEN